MDICGHDVGRCNRVRKVGHLEYPSIPSRIDFSWIHGEVARCRGCRTSNRASF